MDLQGVIYTKIKWKDYMLPNNNPRIARFLRSKGNNVYKQIVEDIGDALTEKKQEILVIVHPNSVHLVSITKDEFDEILDYALEWFLTREDYEYCAMIRDLKTRIGEMV